MIDTGELDLVDRSSDDGPTTAGPSVDPMTRAAGLEDFREFKRNPSRRLRNRLVERHMGFAVHVAGRYTGRGVDHDDLRQVALVGLVKAVDRFDPDRGVAFTTFAGRTIEGEIKRHFRDRTWAVRVPRSLKDLRIDVRNSTERLLGELGRSPRVDEIAADLDATTDAVVETLSTSSAYSPKSIDEALGDSAGAASTIKTSLAASGTNTADVDDRMIIEELIDTLDDREQLIVRLRFWEELTQHEIADRVGLSQMHVSRLLRRSFETMRQAARTSRHVMGGDGASSPLDYRAAAS